MLQQLLKLLDQGRPLLEALKDEQRLELIFVLASETELTVNQLAEKVNISRPTVSHHLKILKSVQLVTMRKEGVMRYYRINLIHMVPYLNDLIFTLQQLYGSN